MRLIRLGLVIAFFVLVGRLYQLQIIQGPDLEARADVNRFRSLEVQPPRGVIYDRNGEILARNRPSFIIAVTPADLPDDDIFTEPNEEAVAMERILRELGVESDREIALSVGEVMFRRLGRADFARTVQDAGVELQFRVVRLPVIEITENEDGTTEETISDVPTIIPDLSQPLPIEGLTALLMRAVTLGTQGSSFEPIPILERTALCTQCHGAVRSSRSPSSIWWIKSWHSAWPKRAFNCLGYKCCKNRCASIPFRI